MTQSDAPRSARALIRLNPNQRETRDSTGVHALPLRGSPPPSPDAAEVLLQETLAVRLLRAAQRKMVLILQLLQVSVQSIT